MYPYNLNSTPYSCRGNCLWGWVIATAVIALFAFVIFLAALNRPIVYYDHEHYMDTGEKVCKYVKVPGDTDLTLVPCENYTQDELKGFEWLPSEDESSVQFEDEVRPNPPTKVEVK